MENEKNFNYPDGFFNFGTGVNIANGEINQWIKDMVIKLNDHEGATTTSVATGNTRVFLEKNIHEYDNKKNTEIRVIVTKNYQTLSLFNEDIEQFINE